MVTAIALRPNGEFRIVEIEGDLDSLGDIVKGHIETIMLNDDMHMYVNEEGKLRSHWQNDVASQFVESYIPHFRDNDYVAGEVVILEHTDEGEECSLTNPAQIAEQLKELGGTEEM